MSDFTIKRDKSNVAQQYVFAGFVSNSNERQFSGSELSIGDCDVIDELEELGGRWLLYCNHELKAEGEPHISCGWGYSSWTQMESDEASVDGFNLISWLEDHLGEQVVVRLVRKAP